MDNPAFEANEDLDVGDRESGRESGVDDLYSEGHPDDEGSEFREHGALSQLDESFSEDEKKPHISILMDCNVETIDMASKEPERVSVKSDAEQDTGPLTLTNVDLNQFWLDTNSDKMGSKLYPVGDGKLDEMKKLYPPEDQYGSDASTVFTENNNKSRSRKKSFAQVDEDSKWLSWVEEQFKDIAGDDQEIDLNEFKTALKVKKSFFAERFFTLFDKDGSGTIELSELMDGLTMLTKGTQSEKLKFLFDVYDVDGSGTIDQEELKTVLLSCMEESAMQISEENIDRLVLALFESADEDESGEISFEELKAELEKHPGIMDNLTISAAQWLKPPEPKKQERRIIPRYLTLKYIQNNFRKVIFVLLYIVINMFLFSYSAIRYRQSNGFLIIARGNGMCLNFNCMFVLVLMLRKSLTWLRSTRVHNYLPLDQNILFHKMVAIVIAVQAALHTAAHLGNVALLTKQYLPPNSTEAHYTFWEYIFTTKPNIGWIAGLAPLTGVLLDVILIVMVVCSMPFVRRSGHFQVFYWTHFLYVLFWLLLILHAPIFWYFFIIPALLFLAEKASNLEIVKIARYGKTYIKHVNLLGSGVTHLVISRPPNFRFRAGDYVFIKIPAIAKYEWHPFTISSAPELKDEFWLHVRSAGHWTKMLYDYFENQDTKLQEYSKIDTANMRRKNFQKHHGELSLKLDTGQTKGVTVTGYKTNQNDNVDKLTEVHVEPRHTGIERASLKKKEFQRQKSRASMRARGSIRKYPRKLPHLNVRVLIDGPYGTSTREIFETEHAVLIGAGIGVTPFASILQSVMYRYRESKLVCPNCSHTWYGETTHTSMTLKKVDFVWINRDQKCFEWFVTLLTQLEMEQSEEGNFDRFLEMHMYMTAALGKADMKAVGLQMALDLLHEKDQVDLLTGLKTRTQAGRPNWDQLFQKMSDEKKGKVKVFFCGSPALGKTLKEKCAKFKFSFSKENF